MYFKVAKKEIWKENTYKRVRPSTDIGANS